MTSITGEDLDRLEEALKELRHTYEKYFAGVERLEPLKDREQVKKRLLRLLGEHSKNTARRFRLQSLQATLVTYEQYWNRVTRQIEEGTFKRDRLRAERLLREQKAAELAVATAEAVEPDVPSDRPASLSPDRTAAKGDLERLTAEALATAATVSSAARSTRPPPAIPTAATAPPPLPSSRQPSGRTGPTASTPLPAVAAGEPGGWIEKLHREYLEARRTIGQSEPVSIDSFAATIRKQASDIKARLRCDSVEFKVAVKDGKAILKATPR